MIDRLYEYIYLKYVSAGNLVMPYCLASRLSLILTKSTPNESVSSSIFSSSAKTLSHVMQLLASKIETENADNLSILYGLWSSVRDDCWELCLLFDADHCATGHTQNHFFSFKRNHQSRTNDYDNQY